MKQLLLTKDLYDQLEQECDTFRAATRRLYDVDPNDILYSYFNSTPECFMIFNDWDEGKSNDPFWNEELNEHSAIVFIKQMVEKLNALN